MAKNPISALKERFEYLKKKVDDPILGNTDLNGHYPNLHDHDPGTTGLSSEEVKRHVDDPILSNSDLNGQNPNLHDHDISYAYVDPKIANMHVNDAYHNSDLSIPTYSPSQDGGVSYAYVDPKVAQMHIDNPYYNSDFAYPTYSNAEQERIDFCGSPDEKIYDAVKSLSIYNFNNINAITNLLDVVKQDPNATDVISKLLDHRMQEAVEMLDKQDFDPSKLGMTFTLINELQKDGFNLDNFVDENYLIGEQPNYTSIIDIVSRFQGLETNITIPGANGTTPQNVALADYLEEIQSGYNSTHTNMEADTSFEP